MVLSYFKEMLADKAFRNSFMVLAIPAMLQQLIVASVNLVDNIMVSRLGDVFLSGVSCANRYYSIAQFATNALVASSVIFLAQYYGAENQTKMKESFRFSLSSSFSLITVFFVLAYLFPENIISFIINDASIIEAGAAYLRIASFSYLPIAIILSISSCLRAIGENRLPLFVSMTSILLNCLLDYLLIFGKLGLPAMGVEGAALATLLARLIEMSIYLCVLAKLDIPFKTRIIDVFSFEWSLAKRIIIRALPLLINEILFTCGNTVLLKCYSSKGAVYNTAYSMAMMVSDLFYILFDGLAAATTFLIGRKLGAGDLKTAKENGYKLICFSLLIAVCFCVMMFGISFLMPYIYSGVSLQAISYAKGFMRILSCIFWLNTVNCECYFVLRAGGDTKNTMFMDSGFMWMLNIPLTVFLTYYLSLPCLLIYAISQSTDALKIFLSFHLVKKEKWVNNLTT